VLFGKSFAGLSGFFACRKNLRRRGRQWFVLPFVLPLGTQFSDTFFGLATRYQLDAEQYIIKNTPH